MSKDKGSSLKPHVTGNFMHDWWFRIQLNPNYLGLDIKFLLVRSGMMGWLLINLSVSAKCIRDENLDRSMILFQIFSSLYIVDYFVYEEYMTSTLDIIAERLGFMCVWRSSMGSFHFQYPGQHFSLNYTPDSYSFHN
ncbi:hypothetical protein QQ045_003554 [Rhodiola kirilowii]